jgi:hypothetical protein
LPAPPLLIESKYAAVAAIIGFLLALLLTHGSLVAAFGAMGLIAGLGWAGRRVFHKNREEPHDD